MGLSRLSLHRTGFKPSLHVIDTDQTISTNTTPAKGKFFPGLLTFFNDRNLRRRYGFAFFLVLSLLLHALLILAPKSELQHPKEQSQAPQMPLTVRLMQPAAPEPAVSPPPQPAPSPKPRPVRRPPPIVALSKPSLPNPRELAPPPLPKPVPPPVPAPAAEEPLDMTAMLNAKRARRAAEQAAVPGNPDPAPASEERSTNDVALANIKRSLQSTSGGRDGAGGVFQIVSKGVRSGQFVFRGWMAGARNNWRQTIDVDAGLNGDIDRAIVRRMIELIRSHYPGDFNWESHRLGRVIVLSARQKDNAELEDFLMQEFFGA